MKKNEKDDKILMNQRNTVLETKTLKDLAGFSAENNSGCILINLQIQMRLPDEFGVFSCCSDDVNAPTILSARHERFLEVSRAREAGIHRIQNLWLLNEALE